MPLSCHYSLCIIFLGVKQLPCQECQQSLFVSFYMPFTNAICLLWNLLMIGTVAILNIFVESATRASQEIITVTYKYKNLSLPSQPPCLQCEAIGAVTPKNCKGHYRDPSQTGRITSWQDAYICQVRSMVLYKYLLFQSHVNTSASSQPVCPFKAGNWNLYSQIISKGQEM